MRTRIREYLFVFAFMAFLLMALALASSMRKVKLDKFAEVGSDLVVQQEVDDVNMTNVGKQSLCLFASTQVDDACDGDVNIGRRLYFGDTSMSTVPNGENGTDPYYMQKIRDGGRGGNSLRLTINDNADESFQIWGNSCVTNGCAGEGMKAHSFVANGFVEHTGSLDAYGNAGIGGQLVVGKDGTYGGTLTVPNDTGLVMGSLNVKGKGSYGKDLSVRGSATSGGKLVVGMNGDFAGKLDVTGDSTFGGNLTVSGTGSFGNSAYVRGPVVVNGMGQFGDKMCLDNECFTAQELVGMKRNAELISKLKSDLDALSVNMRTKYDTLQQTIAAEDLKIRELVSSSYQSASRKLDEGDVSLVALVNSKYDDLAATDVSMRELVRSRRDAMRKSITEEDAKLSSRMAASQVRMQEWRSEVERDAPVTLYENCDYNGNRSSLVEGNYNVGDIGLVNDSISSIKIKPGYVVDVFENKDFAGARATFTADVPCLVHINVGAPGKGNWNDRISSLIISKVGAVVYVDCPFKGQYAMKPVGRYNINEMGVPNDSISSIRVTPGYALTVFEAADFKGRSQTFTSDVSCFMPSYPMWNDIISSFIVSKL